MTDLKAALEAVLFAAGESVPVGRLSLVFAVEQDEVLQAAKELSDEYDRGGRGIRLLRMDNKLQLCSAPEYAQLIVKTLEQRKPPMLSQSALETLAIVAYYQPVTRAVIEKMRGVDSSYTVSALQDRGLIEACGKLEAPGRPTLYATTDAFLRVMGIETLQQLPPLPEVQGSEGTEQLRKSIAKIQEQDSEQQTFFDDTETKNTGA
ncbi:MAG: SMC-Scp complex subunit ScpB [Oscillospiraceae bacterium]|nr:SMC-Scp complex subunit ScpB [Oscillospiraceae bacterium]